MCHHMPKPNPPPLTLMLRLIMLSMAALSHTTLRVASMFIAISLVTAPALATRMANTTRRTMACVEVLCMEVCVGGGREVNRRSHGSGCRNKQCDSGSCSYPKQTTILPVLNQETHTA